MNLNTLVNHLFFIILEMKKGEWAKKNIRHSDLLPGCCFPHISFHLEKTALLH